MVLQQVHIEVVYAETFLRLKQMQAINKHVTRVRAMRAAPLPLSLSLRLSAKSCLIPCRATCAVCLKCQTGASPSPLSRWAHPVGAKKGVKWIPSPCPAKTPRCWKLSPVLPVSVHRRSLTRRCSWPKSGTRAQSLHRASLWCRTPILWTGRN